MMPGMVSCLTIPSSGKATPWDMQVYNSHPDLSWVIPIYETYTGISRVILTCPGCRFSRCWPGRQAGLDWAREPPTDPGRRSEWARGAGVPEGPQSCSYAVISPAESGRRRGRSGWTGRRERLILRLPCAQPISHPPSFAFLGCALRRHRDPRTALSVGHPARTSTHGLCQCGAAG